MLTVFLLILNEMAITLEPVSLIVLLILELAYAIYGSLTGLTVLRLCLLKNSYALPVLFLVMTPIAAWLIWNLLKVAITTSSGKT